MAAAAAAAAAAAGSCIATDADNNLVAMQWLKAGTNAIADIADAMSHVFIVEHTCTDPANSYCESIGEYNSSSSNSSSTTDSILWQASGVDCNSPLTSCSSAIVLLVKALLAVAEQLYDESTVLAAGSADSNDPLSLAAPLRSSWQACGKTEGATASCHLLTVRNHLDKLCCASSERHRATTVWGLKYGSDAQHTALPIWLRQAQHQKKLSQLLRQIYASRHKGVWS